MTTLAPETPDYNNGTSYYTLLLFHDHSFWDLIDPNGWEIYGEYTPMTSGSHRYIRRDNITHDIPWFASRCDLEKSRFNEEENLLSTNIEYILSTNNAFSSVAPGGYLYHRNDITVEGEYSTMACWFKIRSEDALEFYGSDAYHVTLADWDNERNQHIHVEIRARDDTDKLIECIKVYYDSKMYQTNYIEPILNGTWYYFEYAVDSQYDYYFINGELILKLANNRGSSFPDMKYKNIKIGAHDNWSSGGLTIDEFIIINDFLPSTNGWTPPGPIVMVRPESIHVEDLDEEKNLYYQMGSTLRVDYILYSPETIKSPYLEFENVEGVPLALFKDGKSLPSTAWRGNVRKIELLRPVDISAITTSKFVLVTLVKYIPTNNKGKINGASVYDHVLHPIRITRISYWTRPEDAITNMFNKIKWYQNNKIPMSDFRYTDKFHPEYKHWY